MRASITSVALLLVAFGCNREFNINQTPTPEVATPPGSPDPNGEPPNWQDCFQGFLGEYSNLPITHPDVEPDPLVEEPVYELAELDWWDNPSFQEFSPSLDFGSNWWPVDEGLEGDPAYYTVKWNAWLRAWDDVNMEFSVGAADDVWILLNDEVVYTDQGIKDFDPQTQSINIDAGQYPIEIRYAHRGGQSGFRFRVISDLGPPNGVSLCYAEYNEASGPDDE